MDFTNQRFNTKDVTTFIRQYSKNKLTSDEIAYITRCCYIYKLNALVVLAKLQQESGIVENSFSTIPYTEKWNKAMGARLYSYYTKKPRMQNWGFYNQIRLGCEILRFNFNDFEYGNEITLIYKPENNQKIYPLNASTWCLYVYCPAYAKMFNPDTGSWAIGNQLFVEIFQRYKKRWIKMYGEF